MLLVCLGLAGRAWAVAAAKPPFDSLLEAVYSHCTEDVPYEVLQERLWERYHAPLELNQAARETLQRLCILTEEQLDQLDRHLAKNGPLVAIYELQAIPAFDLPTIQRLVPFVKVEEAYYYNRAFWAQGLGARNSYALLRYARTLETERGYQRDPKNNKVPYAGSPDGFLTRLSLQHPGAWGVGLAASSKAGEALTWDPDTQRYGPSLSRFHGFLKHRKSLQALVVGDYAVGYGQGLVLNAGFSMNKSSETVKVIRTNNLGIRPHMSLANAAFRGVATTWQWQPIELTTYYSTVDLDGRLREDASGRQYVQSISRGGYYRTANEIATKGQVNEQVIGSTLVYRGLTRGTVLGINALYSHYSLPIKPDIRRGNPLRFRGQDHANGSLFYGYLWQNFHFFGEGALSKNGGKAAIVGVVASLSRYVDTTVLWRHYDQDFHGPFGKGFKENAANNSNEQGCYLGARIRPWQRLYLDAYYDYFYFPWVLGQASAGHSWLAKATYQPNRASIVYLQSKTTAKARRIPKTIGTKHNYKLYYKYTLSRAVSLHSEAQCSNYQQLDKLTWGYAAVQDVAYQIGKLQLKGRVAWFSTEDWANRLIFYEPDVLYSGFNFPALQGQGMRYCLVVCYQPTPAFRLAMKYVLTHYRDRTEIGSSQATIAGNVKNNVRLQAIFRF